MYFGKGSVRIVFEFLVMYYVEFMNARVHGRLDSGARRTMSGPCAAFCILMNVHAEIAGLQLRTSGKKPAVTQVDPRIEPPSDSPRATIGSASQDGSRQRCAPFCVAASYP